MKKLFIPLFAMVMIITAGIQAHAMSYKDITPTEAMMLMEKHKDLVIIDVSPYFDKGHIPGAINITVRDLDDKIPMLDKNKMYLVYCHADGPAIRGAQKLIDAGFKKVYRLLGNYGGWVAAGYNVEM